MVIMVGTLEDAMEVLRYGLTFGGARFRTGLYWEAEPGSLCPRCCGNGHWGFKACEDLPHPNVQYAQSPMRQRSTAASTLSRVQSSA